MLKVFRAFGESSSHKGAGYVEKKTLLVLFLPPNSFTVDHHFTNPWTSQFDEPMLLPSLGL